MYFGYMLACIRPLLKKGRDPHCRVTVAVRVDRPAHLLVYSRIVKQSLGFLDNARFICANQQDSTSGHRFGPLGRLPCHQDRFTKRRRFFLHAAGIRKDKPRLMHRIDKGGVL